MFHADGSRWYHAQGVKSDPVLAGVASVSVGLSAGLKHFSLLERAKIGVSAKKYESVALATIFAPPKSEKWLERAEKTYGNACYAG